MTKPVVCDCRDCELRSLFFNNVKDREFGNICTSKYEQNFKNGDIIIQEGEGIKEFLYLKSGLVKLFKTGEGNRDQIIKIAKPFDFVSMLSVFSDTHFRYSVSALEDSTVCYVDLDTIKNLVKTNGQFAIDLLERMSKTSDDIIKTNLEINRKNLRGRIAYVLLYFSKVIYKSNSFELPISRKEMAEFIEMTTENVIRTLSEFRKDQIIKINGKIIEIIDPERLERICNLG